MNVLFNFNLKKQFEIKITFDDDNSFFITFDDDNSNRPYLLIFQIMGILLSPNSHGFADF